MEDKTPPNNIEAEQALLGSVLIDNDCMEKLNGAVTKDDFYDFKHKDIFDAMEYLYKKEIPVDLLSLSNRLKAKRKLKRVGGHSYLASLVTEAVATSSNALHYARIISDCSIRRGLIDKAYKIMEGAYDESKEMSDVIDEADKSISIVAEQNSVKLGDEKPTSIKDLALRFDTEYDDKDNIGLFLGMPALDNLLNGIKGGEIIGLTGDPGTGKTALSLGMALSVAKSGKRVLFINLEMNEMDVIGRLISIYSGVDNTGVRTKKMEREVIDFSLCKLSEMNLDIMTPSAITSSSICRITTLQNKKKPIDLIFIDYINRVHENFTEEKDRVEKALDNFKALAMRLEIPIVLPFQMNYAGRMKERPTMNDARSSSHMSDICGVMLSLKNNNSPEIDLALGERQVDLWITKNRHGVANTKLPMKFDTNSLKFIL